MRIIEAHSIEFVPEVWALFKEYAAEIEVCLCFQNFDQELAGLPGQYAPPDGRLFLAIEATHVAGCAGLRKIEHGICEMKRLYVRTAFRGQGIGRALALAAINAARQIGYTRMRLDTLASMTAAIKLYRALGFLSIAPYCENPNQHAVFMELSLT